MTQSTTLELTVTLNQETYVMGMVGRKVQRGIMMTSSNEKNFRVTGPLCGEFTGHRWIPLTKAMTRRFDFFLSAPE